MANNAAAAMELLVDVGNEWLGVMLVYGEDGTYSMNVRLLRLFQLIVHVYFKTGFVFDVNIFFYRISIGFSIGSWHNVR